MIQLKKIDKSYGQVQVLHNFSMHIKMGEQYYISGDSGCGKTTLLRIIMGLEQVDAGEVNRERQNKFAVVFQEDRLIEELDVWTNLSISSKRSPIEIQSYLNVFGLEGFERASVDTLSGGMKRRVAILRALLSDFDILLLDEPFKGLDDERKSVIIEEMKRCLKGKTVLLVTHSREEASLLGITNEIVL
ncbi:MAG: ATP-binding cassette domain-containing protein [Eubacteriales bacterium]